MVHGEDLLKIQHLHMNGVTVLRCQGEIDVFTAPHFRKSIEEARAQGGPVLLDMALVTFMDSTGVSALIDAGRGPGEDPGRVELLNPSSAVRRLMEISGFDAVVTVRSTAA